MSLDFLIAVQMALLALSGGLMLMTVCMFLLCEEEETEQNNDADGIGV